MKKAQIWTVILLLAAAAAYWFFFRKKPSTPAKAEVPAKPAIPAQPKGKDNVSYPAEHVISNVPQNAPRN